MRLDLTEPAYQPSLLLPPPSVGDKTSSNIIQIREDLLHSKDSTVIVTTTDMIEETRAIEIRMSFTTAMPLLTILRIILLRDTLSLVLPIGVLRKDLIIVTETILHRLLLRA